MIKLNENKSIYTFDLKPGISLEWLDSEFPGRLYSWTDKDDLQFGESNTKNTFFGYVFSGKTELTVGDSFHQLTTACYFSLNQNFRLKGGSGIIIERINYFGANIIGGPLENEGRLQYIDGCTDTLLISPPKLGEPCLNALYFPKNINQTAHTHPSYRVGIVAKGFGECVTQDGIVPLFSGKIFMIPKNKLHNFKTQDSKMIVIAFHPDSDFGPQDQNHPMINRTIIPSFNLEK